MRGPLGVIEIIYEARSNVMYVNLPKNTKIIGTQKVHIFQTLPLYYNANLLNQKVWLKN